MSQSGYTPISLYYSSTASAVPTAGNLVAGELALNNLDGKLFYKDNAGVVQTIAGKGGAGVAGGSNTQVQYNSSGSLAGSANMTFDGTTLSTTAATVYSAGASTVLTVGGNAASTVPEIRFKQNSATRYNFQLGIGVQVNDAFTITPSTAIGGTTFTTPTLTATYDGNVGIGSTPVNNRRLTATTASQTDLSLVAGSSNYAQLLFGYTGADNKGIVAYNNADNSMQFYTNSSERMRIDSSGNLLVGATATVNAAKAYFGFTSSNNGVYIADTTGVSGAQFMRFDTASSVTCGSIVRVAATSAVTYNTTSDYRLKTVTAPVSNAGERIDLLEPVEYDWNTGGRARGFLAHQFAEVYPNSVSGEKDAVDEKGKPIYQAMQSSSSEVMADLIAEIQSLRKRVAQLESK